MLLKSFQLSVESAKANKHVHLQAANICLLVSFLIAHT